MKQKVTLNDSKCSVMESTTGVLQGTILGNPLPFIIYLNYLLSLWDKVMNVIC